VFTNVIGVDGDVGYAAVVTYVYGPEIPNGGLRPDDSAMRVRRLGMCTRHARWYQSGIIWVMGMTLRPSEQQAEALRRQAAAEGRSMQAIALSAIDEYIARRAHKAKVAAALQRVVREEAGVLERLKDA
jgi:hypothetical protein